MQRFANREDVEFLIVYQREPHPRRMAFRDIPQPETFAERLALAERTASEFQLGSGMLVDGMDDRARALFGDQPNSLVVIAPDRKVQLKQPWADPDELGEVLPVLLQSGPRRVLREAAAGTASDLTRAAACLLRSTGEDTEGRRVDLSPGQVPFGELQLLVRLHRLRQGAPLDIQLLADTGKVFAERPLAHAAYLAQVHSATPTAAGPEPRRAVLSRMRDVVGVKLPRVRGWIMAQDLMDRQALTDRPTSQPKKPGSRPRG